MTHDPGDPAIFFVHIMKTGGTTLFRNLRGNYALDELYPYRPLDIKYDGDTVDVRHHLSVSYLLGISEERRQSIRVYTGHFPFVASELLGGPLTRVTILRDPVERTISLLRQFKRKAPTMDDADWLPKDRLLTLDEVYDSPMVFEPLIRDHQTKVFSMRASDAPESYMDVIEVDDARLALAKRNLATVDVIGLTERYDAFLDEVEARFGWSVERDARANATPAADMEPASESLRRRIAEDNAIDVELYRYATQLVDERAAGD